MAARIIRSFVIGLLFIVILFHPFFVVSGQNGVRRNDEMCYLRDSLDAIQYPSSFYKRAKGREYVLKIRTQEDWDNFVPSLRKILDSGHQNILIKIIGDGIVFGDKQKVFLGWNYPYANISLFCKRATIIPYGVVVKKSYKDAKKEGNFYSLPYNCFDVNDIILDKKGNEIPIREEANLVGSIIEEVSMDIPGVWRFRIDLPNIDESMCNDFYVLITRDWTSARHKVLKVQDGWLYYQLDSDDLHSNRNPNVDWTQYGVRPRYRLINNPLSDGIHIINGRIYIPKSIKKIQIIKGGHLITFAHCCFNSLVISGFKINGSGNGIPFGLYSCSFEEGAYITNNSFSNLSSLAIGTAHCNNVTIANNTIKNTRVQAIEAGGLKTTICNNHLSNIGWMLNTRAITGSGEELHICDNIIEDFNYSAIACGSTTPNDKAVPLSYIIERNIIRLTKDYIDNFLQNTLADGGGIYIGPQCTQGIIRNNVVENIKGIHNNIGIYLDDGAKNIAVYGNLVLNTANSYDIDLRLCKTYSKGIPDHNTNNCMFDNILTGTYRFQDGGEGSNCVEGNNIRVENSLEFKMLKKAIIDSTIIKSIKVDEFVRNYLKIR